MNTDRSGGRRSVVRLLVAFCVAAVPFVVSVPAAFAGVGLGITPNFPASVAVGATNVAGSITITNLSNGAESTGNVTLGQITLVPSCGTFTALANCPAAGVDLGVFQVSSTATGRAGTACAGKTFTVTTLNATTGRLRLTPNSAIVLGAPASATATCVIDFTFDVLKVPTKDVSSAAGVQTEQIASTTGTHDDGTPGSGTGTSVVTVTEVTPPSCVMSAVIANGIQVTVQDPDSGLPAGGIVVNTAVNANVVIPPFTAGTTSAVVVTATKIAAGPSQVGLTVTDRSGNVTTCDPTDFTIDRSSGQPVTSSQTGVPAAEHLINVYNGTPGLVTLVVNVNGHVSVLHLRDGQVASLDVASAMRAGSANTVKLTGAGRPGSTARIILHD